MRRRALVVAAALPLALACRSESSTSSCAHYEGAASRALPHTSGPVADPQWRTRLAGEIAAMAADSVVETAFVHASAAADADREHVVAFGGTVVGSAPSMNAVIARIAVGDLRRFASESGSTRVIDVHLMRDLDLPPCT